MAQQKTEENFNTLVKYLAANLGFIKPATIVELGARDCNETLALHQTYPTAKILSFECNPDKLPECRNRVKNIPQITLVEKAVSDKSGEISFYQIDTEKTETQWADGNPGASSLLKASNNYPLEKYIQKEVKVDCTTLAEELPRHNIKNVDVLWMDIQGSELNALKGLGDLLNNVAVIHTEVEFMAIYQNQPLFWDIKKYLNSRGFYVATFTSFDRNYSGDALFVNINQPGIGIWNKLKYRFTNKTQHLLRHYGFAK